MLALVRKSRSPSRAPASDPASPRDLRPAPRPRSVRRRAAASPASARHAGWSSPCRLAASKPSPDLPVQSVAGRACLVAERQLPVLGGSSNSPRPMLDLPKNELAIATALRIDDRNPRKIHNHPLALCVRLCPATPHRGSRLRSAKTYGRGLEGWPRALNWRPSFETHAQEARAPQDEVGVCGWPIISLIAPVSRRLRESHAAPPPPARPRRSRRRPA